MSQQKINQQSIQITTTGAKTLIAETTNEGDSVDIQKLLIANTSASTVLVTVSDGVNNYYYSVGANSTVVDNNLAADSTSTGWTAQTASGVTSIYVSAIFD